MIGWGVGGRGRREEGRGEGLLGGSRFGYSTVCWFDDLNIRQFAGFTIEFSDCVTLLRSGSRASEFTNSMEMVTDNPRSSFDA